MAINRLSATKAAKVKKRGRYSDGGGLWLQISRWGTRSWIFQFSSPQSGRIRQMGLGSFRTISLAEAREKALQARKQVLDGQDPIEAGQAAKAGEVGGAGDPAHLCQLCGAVPGTPQR